MTTVYRADVEDDEDDYLWHTDPTCHIGPEDRLAIDFADVGDDIRKCRICGDLEDPVECHACGCESHHPWQCSECGADLTHAHPLIESVDGTEGNSP